MSENVIFTKRVRNNARSGFLGSFWKTGGKLVVYDDSIVLRSFFKSIYFDRKRLTYERENKEEVLYNRIVRLHNEQYDYSVQMSPRQFNKFLTIMERQ